ncbi:hypothetical protein EDD16DRAFT_1604919 [Pisolithus croceorrhizus]|nr:hypothetical protein EDD16DRAFT_1604919 [Pisolithus croceorrhizus]
MARLYRGMLHHPSTYSDPMDFNPDGFLPGEGLTNLAQYISAGLHLADASVWTCAAMSLAVFEISKVVENRVEITLEVDPVYGSGVRFDKLKAESWPKCSRKFGLSIYNCSHFVVSAALNF